MSLHIRPASECELDLVSLGECMVRLSPPGHGRIEFAHTLEVHVGGGEYNVAYAVARLGLRAGWVGGVCDNPVGRIVLNHARAAGLDVSHAMHKKWDGVGRENRMGLNFSEVGIGVRPSITMYDRGHTATCAMKPGDVDWRGLLQKRGVRWLHTGGIFSALSLTTRQVALEAVSAASAVGTVVSYDLNYRASLWNIEQAIAATHPLLPHVNCFIGNIGQFQIVLGRPVEGFDLATDSVEPGAFERVVDQVTHRYPRVSMIATTLREVRSGCINDFSAMMWHEGKVYHGPRYENLEIHDRIGGGDAFAGGLIYGLLSGADPQESINLGTACGALCHTTPGDTSQVTLAEVRHVAAGGSARIVR
jgi:2-dehydro-3-deoxygluconokinase